MGGLGLLVFVERWRLGSVCISSRRLRCFAADTELHGKVYWLRFQFRDWDNGQRLWDLEIVFQPSVGTEIV